MSNILALAGLLLVIFSIPLPFQKTIYLSTIYPCDLIFGLIFSAWLAHTIIIKGLRHLKGKKVFLFFLPFIVAGAISIINAKDLFRFAGYIYLWSQMPLAYIMAATVASLICFFMNNILDFTLDHEIAIQSGIILTIVDAPQFQSK